MSKPILLSVDDDSDVLRSIERDLRAQYGAEYRVIGSDSPTAALELLNQLKLRNDSLALLLADQRMPQMDGVGFLQEARQIFPEAKRALLTAYADTNAAINAINQANIDYFFMKPGTLLRSTSIRNWMICSMTGVLPTVRHLRESGFWARGGRRGRMNCGISWRETTCPISGSILSNLPMTPKLNACLKHWVRMRAKFLSCFSRTGRSCWKPYQQRWRSGSDCARARKPIFTIWQSSAEDRRVWLQRCMEHPKGCIR